MCLSYLLHEHDSRAFQGFTVRASGPLFVIIQSTWGTLLTILFWEISSGNQEKSCVPHKDGLQHQEICSDTQSAHILVSINTRVLTLLSADWLLAGTQPISNDPFTLLPRLSTSERNSHCCTHGCNNHRHHESNNIFCFHELLSSLKGMWVESITQRTHGL